MGTIWFSAPHYKTNGAEREGLGEERWAKPIIIEVVNRLNTMGHANVVWMGVNGHEMDQDDDGSIKDDDVVISLHFNVGNAMVLYNQNPKNVDWIDAYFRAHLPKEISYSGKILRNDLDMLHGEHDNAERYLLEMGDVRDADDRAIMSNKEFMVNFLVGMALEIFLGGGAQNPNNEQTQTNGATAIPNKSMAYLDANVPCGVVESGMDGATVVTRVLFADGTTTVVTADRLKQIPFAEVGRIVGLDSSMDKLGQIIEYGQDHQGTVARVRYADNTSDVVYAFRLLPHLPNFVQGDMANVDGIGQMQIEQHAVDKNGDKVYRVSTVVYANKVRP